MSLNVVSIAPQTGEPPTGLFIALHGWGANAQDVAALATFLDLPHCQLLFPDAPFPFPYGPMGRAWYNFPQDYTFTCEPRLAQQPDLVESRQILMTWLQSLEAKTGVPLSRTVLAGFSQGGAMTLDVGLQLPLAALLVLSGYLHSPAHLSAENAPPVLMVHGRQDTVVPLQSAQNSYRQLQDLGVAVTYHELDMGHEIPAAELQLVQNFTIQILRHSDQTP